MWGGEALGPSPAPQTRGSWGHTEASPSTEYVQGIRGCWANVAKLWDHKLVALRLGYPRVLPASLSLSLGVVSEFLLYIAGVLGMSEFFWVSLGFLNISRCC